MTSSARFCVVVLFVFYFCTPPFGCLFEFRLVLGLWFRRATCGSLALRGSLVQIRWLGLAAGWGVICDLNTIVTIQTVRGGGGE